MRASAVGLLHSSLGPMVIDKRTNPDIIKPRKVSRSSPVPIKPQIKDGTFALISNVLKNMAMNSSIRPTVQVRHPPLCRRMLCQWYLPSANKYVYLPPVASILGVFVRFRFFALPQARGEVHIEIETFACRLDIDLPGIPLTLPL